MTALPDHEREIVALTANCVDRRVRPRVAEFEEADRYPEDFIEEIERLGFFGLLVPEEHGGSAVSTACFARVTEELARRWMSLAGAIGGHSVIAYLLATVGTPEQRERYLPRMAGGGLRATMALTEPGGGSDLQAMRTHATGWATSTRSPAARRGSPTPSTRSCSGCCAAPTATPCRRTPG
ncbi:acyl-CoA dehydrogenase family protein [Blastococcus sp. SYSU DS0973]